VISGTIVRHVDLAGGYGTIRESMSGSRWLALLTFVAVIARGASSASAQVFRPRNGKALPVSKAALAAAATPAPATARKTGADAEAPATSPAKKAARPAEGTPRHAQNQGSQGKKKRGKHRDDADDVKIDDDDDDVKITDD
jgi:hypothetical protein